MAKRAVRRGITPAERPTEWTSALIMLVVALAAFNSDHDVAALLAVAGACVPVIATAVFSWWEARHAVTATEPVEVVK